MRQSCNSVNVYAKSCKRLLNVYTNMTVSEENEMVYISGEPAFIERKLLGLMDIVTDAQESACQQLSRYTGAPIKNNRA